MIRHKLSFLLIFFFLLLAIGSTDESDDPTDTEILRDCEKLEIPKNVFIKSGVFVKDKITGERIENAVIDFKVTTYKFDITDEENCKGKLVEEKFSVFSYVTGGTGLVEHDHGNFNFEDKNDIIIVDISCQAPAPYSVTIRKGYSIKYNSNYIIYLAFSLLSNNDL